MQLVKVKRATLSTKTVMAAMTMRKTKKMRMRRMKKKMKTTQKKTPPNQKTTMKSRQTELSCTTCSAEHYMFSPFPYRYTPPGL